MNVNTRNSGAGEKKAIIVERQLNRESKLNMGQNNEQEEYPTTHHTTMSMPGQRALEDNDETRPSAMKSILKHTQQSKINLQAGKQRKGYSTFISNIPEERRSLSKHVTISSPEIVAQTSREEASGSGSHSRNTNTQKSMEQGQERKGFFAHQSNAPQERRSAGLSKHVTITELEELKQGGSKSLEAEITSHNDKKRARPILLKTTPTFSCRSLGVSLPRSDLGKTWLIGNEQPKNGDQTTSANQKGVSKNTNKALSVAQIRVPSQDMLRSKVIDFETDRESWRTAFNAAMTDLEALMVPRITKEDMLKKICAPFEKEQNN